MRIGVTGGSGFIGRGITDKLLDANYSVISFVRQKNLISKHKLNEIRYIDDINVNSKWNNFLKGVDVVIHTAAKVHVISEGSYNNQENYNIINAKSTIDLAKQASYAGVKKFIFLSSVKVNGDVSQRGNPFTEKILPQPKGFYAKSKYIAETGLLKMRNETQMDIIILRLPLVYGINVKGNFLKLIRLIQKGLPLPFGLINNNRRSYLSLDNLTDLIFNIINSKNKTQDVFLVSDDDDVSTSTLFIKLANSLEKNIFLVPLPPFILTIFFFIFNKKEYSAKLFGDLQVDISKVKKTFNWKPTLNFEECLKKIQFKKYY